MVTFFLFRKESLCLMKAIPHFLMELNSTSKKDLDMIKILPSKAIHTALMITESSMFCPSKLFFMTFSHKLKRLSIALTMKKKLQHYSILKISFLKITLSLPFKIQAKVSLLSSFITLVKTLLIELCWQIWRRRKKF